MSDTPFPSGRHCRPLKERQLRTGLLAALVLGLAVLVLADGLQGLMRAGSSHLDIIAGQGTMLSGPIGIDKPRDSDLLVSVAPEGARRWLSAWTAFLPATGSATPCGAARSWRSTGAAPGTYTLSVRVRGTPASATQRYEITVWSDAASLRQGSFSLTVSLLGFNPFWLSGILACIGIVPGLLSLPVRPAHRPPALAGGLQRGLPHGAPEGRQPAALVPGLQEGRPRRRGPVRGGGCRRTAAGPGQTGKKGRHLHGMAPGCRGPAGIRPPGKLLCAAFRTARLTFFPL